MFPLWITDLLILVINTVSAVAGPFETTDNLLATKDPTFMHVQMHGLALLSCLIWGLDYIQKGTTIMVFANFAGLSCEIITFIAYFHTLGKLHPESGLLMFVDNWQKVFYRYPTSLIGG